MHLKAILRAVGPYLVTLELEIYPSPLNFYVQKLSFSSRLKSLKELSVYQRPTTVTGLAGAL